jgi:hypothetical protein
MIMFPSSLSSAAAHQASRHVPLLLLRPVGGASADQLSACGARGGHRHRDDMQGKEEGLCGVQIHECDGRELYQTCSQPTRMLHRDCRLRQRSSIKENAEEISLSFSSGLTLSVTYCRQPSVIKHGSGTMHYLLPDIRPSLYLSDPGGGGEHIGPPGVDHGARPHGAGLAAVQILHQAPPRPPPRGLQVE